MRSLCVLHHRAPGLKTQGMDGPSPALSLAAPCVTRRPPGVTGDASFVCADINDDEDSVSLYNPAR